MNQIKAHDKQAGNTTQQDSQFCAQGDPSLKNILCDNGASP